MMVSDKKLANAMGGRTARACDSCISKRARWYCPADDAFLCQGCDSSVHSANPLARRHERVRLKTASIKPSKGISVEISVPSWQNGITKKARTPRNQKHAKPKFEESTSEVNVINPLDLVPEFCDDDNSHEENDEQLLYRVPIFDPFAQDLCNNSSSNERVTLTSVEHDQKCMHNDSCTNDANQLHGSLPSELDLAEFAADVESLLGKGLDDESFDIEGLGLSDCKEYREDDDQMENSTGRGEVKVEDGGEIMFNDQVDGEFDMGRETFEFNFDFDSSMACDDDYNMVHDDMGENCKVEEGNMNNGNKKILLRLDYDGVMSAWADQKSPWTSGERPELDPYGCWPVCMGTCGTIHTYGDIGIFGNPAITDGGREARVSRYREKRRTRLFSKKIRYEVRKLNAEKRPRMKGRFVKRSNFPASAFPLQHNK